MIDLHTHTTASDGRCSPDELVARAVAAGVTVLGVTDHDTVAGCAAAAAACAAAGRTFVPGIEITAVQDEKDVHMLGYFIDLRSAPLARFLALQRLQRVDRIRQMADRLREQGIDIDAEAILAQAGTERERAVGRPWIARALVAAGHVATIGEAFDRWLAHGRAAFVPRAGAPPAQVIERIHESGGVASLAHPGLVARDEWIPSFVDAGLDAIEVYHSEHDAEMTARYLATAERYGIGVSGGSDYHGDDSHGPTAPGAVALPQKHFDHLVELKSRAVPRP